MKRPCPYRVFVASCAILLSSASINEQSMAAAQNRRMIAVNYSRVKGKHNTFFLEVVGAGRAAEGLRAGWLRDLSIVHRECGFKYIRFHGLLQDELGVYSEDKQGRPIYNFQYVDALYDAILSAGMRPIQHWTMRYGVDELKRWYFEIWNEPNLNIFWSGDQAEYFKLYEVTTRAIKSVSPAYRVGGPATAGHGWIPEMINFANQKHVPLDFVSTHDYGVKGIGADESGVQQLYLVPDKDTIIGGVRTVRAQIASSAIPKLPLHYTEWSTSYSPRDPVHDSYISAAYILSKLKGTEGYADSMSYWTFTDIFEENGPVPSPFHGGFGLLNFQGLRKPAFYAYQFLHKLGAEELQSNDEESWACRSANGAQILFWNFTPPITKESDQKFFKRDLPAKAVGTVHVSITGLPRATYQLNLFSVGYQVNDVYADYLKMGSPPTLTREQVRELAKKNDGHAVTSERVTVSADGAFQRDLPLRENDLYLITLEKS